MADTGDIGGAFGQVGGSGGVLPSFGTADTSPGVRRTGYSEQDVISSAAIEQAMMAHMIRSADVPVLNPSTFNAGISGLSSAESRFAMMQMESLHRITMNMLDAWSDSITEMAERTRREDSNPVHLARVEEQRRDRLGIVESFRSAVDNISRSENPNALALVATSLVITAGFTGYTAGVTDVVSTNMVSFTPQVDEMSGVFSQQAGLMPGDMRAELSMLGALMVNLAVRYTEIEGMNASKATDPRAAASSYADKILKIVNSDQIGTFLMALLVAKGENSQQIPPERAAQLSATVKTILLATALAALYKAAYGGMTPQEFKDLMTGKMAPKTEQETMLVFSLRENLAAMDPAEKESLIDGLANWAASAKLSLEPGKAFSAFLASQQAPLDTMPS